MKREALYHADTNELEELRQIEAPSISPNEFIEGTDEYIACFIAWQNYLKHCNSLRRLPCSPQPGFKDGEKYVEGVDYEVKTKCTGKSADCLTIKNCQYCEFMAFPIAPVESWGKLTLAELEEPIGNFILNQKDVKPVMAPDGAYYHYKDVCVMLARYRHYKPQKQ